MSTVSEKITFFNRIFGTCVIGTDGLNVAVCCPNTKCGSYGSAAKKKLVIRIDSDHYHCWVCDIKGRNLIYLLRSYFPHFLIEYQEKFYSKKNKLILPDQDVVVPVVVPKDFRLLATSLGSKDPDIKDTIRYVRSRGLTNRDLWYFKFGTCATGRYRRRVIMPSFDEVGDINYFVARTIDQDDKKMKYINAKVSKKNVIFNEINIDWDRELTLVEGPFDLTKCDSNSTCLLGSHFSEDYSLFQKIIKSGTSILLAMDADMTSKAQEYAKKLSSYGVDVRILNLGPYSDVGEMTKIEFLTAKKQAKGWSSKDRLYHLIGSIKSGSLF
jgi:hypothetical protein